MSVGTWAGVREIVPVGVRRWRERARRLSSTLGCERTSIDQWAEVHEGEILMFMSREEEGNEDEAEGTGNPGDTQRRDSPEEAGRREG